MNIRYQTDVSTDSLSSGIIKELKEVTGIEFYKADNKALLFCRYEHRGISQPHRDRLKTLDVSEDVIFPEYSVIVQLTEPERDYVNSNDSFFINWDIKLVSRTGKEVQEWDESSRFYPNLTKGDCIVFRNDNSIHGVDEVMIKDRQQGRITIGFRSL